MNTLLDLKRQYTKEIEEKEMKSIRLSRIRVFTFLLFLVFLILYSNTPSILLSIFVFFFLLLFIILVIYHGHVDKKMKVLENYITIIEKYEERKSGNWKSEKEDAIDADFFLSDLDILGKNSLFQFLDFTSSLGGKRKLTDTLSLKNVKEKTILENQEVMKELKDNFPFILFFEEKVGEIKNIKNIDFKEYFSFFDRKIGEKKLELCISFLLSFLSILTLTLSIFGILSPGYFVGLFFLQLMASFFYTSIYREEFDTIASHVRTFSELVDTYNFIEEQKFISKKCQYLQKDILKGKDVLERMNKLAILNAYRYNLITNVLFNVFFSLNFLLLYKYADLLKKDSQNFKNSILALEEFEVLTSLTTICFVKENICLPVITKNITLDITSMKHPLLEEKNCISNQFQCGQDIQIITGSNMSGKTSFMRTIGINLVLAYTGAYVNASKFTCPILKIFTSINVKDDISNGISTFYGELQRIKNVLDFSKDNQMPMIIFIDEIFKGTNYNDRILGAKEVLKKLSNLSCIVFLTTHDFELCEINNKKIHNYHFEETYKKNKISFDYKIKSGQCKTTNAKYLMKQIGIMD